jgi:DNA-binding MarR family transcriptional regulator
MVNVKQKNQNKNDVTEVADRIHSVAIHLLRQVRKQDAAAGIGPAQLSALSVLVFGGAITLGKLAEAEQVKPPTMSRIVTGLERNRLAEREVDAKDSRLVQVRATAKGARLLHEGRRRRIEYLARNLDFLSVRELETLKAAVEVLQRALERWGRPD